MRLFKFSLVVFTFLLSTKIYSFSTNECLKKDFHVQVDHKGFPFGLLDVKLGIEKQGCVLTVSHQEYKYLNERWIIDVCRGPVHIKKGTNAIDVIKKTANCSSTSKDEFCSEAKALATTLQDDGLIFATGIKEELESDHGKVFCSFLLLNKYFQDSVIFNKFDQYDDDLGSLKGAKHFETQSSPSSVSESSSSSSTVIPRPVMEEDASDQELPVEEKAPTGEGSF